MLEKVAETKIHYILGNEKPDVIHIQDFDLTKSIAVLLQPQDLSFPWGWLLYYKYTAHLHWPVDLVGTNIGKAVRRQPFRGLPV
jgi:hypothetical protein